MPLPSVIKPMIEWEWNAVERQVEGAENTQFTTPQMANVFS